MFCYIKLRRPATFPGPSKRWKLKAWPMWWPRCMAMPTDEYSFPYVAGWAGGDADKAVRGTQARGQRGGAGHHRGVAGGAHGGREAARHRLGNGTRAPP